LGRILQVVGYQNSGKTTFVVEYIEAAVRQKLKVGTIKHHGHLEAIKMDDQRKDTGKHRQAGAQVTLVEGNGSLVLTSEKLSLSLSQMVTLYSQFQLDVIIVEGFKLAAYPKVVLVTSQADLLLLNDLLNISCVIARFQLPKEITERFQTFYHTKECIEWLLTNKVGEMIE
jgi:molybdopterin-guanine dinucleotide biosynthesis protein B